MHIHIGFEIDDNFYNMYHKTNTVDVGLSNIGTDVLAQSATTVVNLATGDILKSRTGLSGKVSDDMLDKMINGKAILNF